MEGQDPALPGAMPPHPPSERSEKHRLFVHEYKWSTSPARTYSTRRSKRISQISENMGKCLGAGCRKRGPPHLARAKSRNARHPTKFLFRFFLFFDRCIYAVHMLSRYPDPPKQKEAPTTPSTVSYAVVRVSVVDIVLISSRTDRDRLPSFGFSLAFPPASSLEASCMPALNDDQERPKGLSRKITCTILSVGEQEKSGSRATLAYVHVLLVVAFEPYLASYCCT